MKRIVLVVLIISISVICLSQELITVGTDTIFKPENKHQLEAKSLNQQPNANFSNISVINAYTDRIGLEEGWNWLSFPRLERAGNDPFPSTQVLGNINYYPDVELLLKNEQNLQKIWDGSSWSGYLNNVISTSGYKLDLETLSDDNAPEVKLYGAILDPETQITLNPNTENWVGYFLEDAQMPLDAIPSGVLQHVTEIKAQNWAMIHTNSEPEWRYKGTVAPIQYGDMIIIYVDAQQTLQWNQPQEAAEAMAAPETEFYTYEEQADYLPIFVETDANSDIQEIAVLANGEVHGAGVRMPGDTITQVSAYLEGVPTGTPLTFETWNGYKSAPNGKNAYAVFNPEKQSYESRTLYIGERAAYHAVTLKAGVEAEVLSDPVNVDCAPNPFSDETTFTVRVNRRADVALTIHDMNGRKLASLMDSEIPEGLYHVNWNGTADNGSAAGKGVYYYSLKINGQMNSSGKVVLIR